jgi:hypothetical protein
MKLDPNNDTVRWAVFGESVKLFLESDIGDFLLKRSESEIDAAVQELKTVSPRDVDTITDLQNRIKVAEMFQGWLADAIAAGEQAKIQIAEENE